jgi:cytochrome c-type biogenesis protein CcmH/NrfG
MKASNAVSLLTIIFFLQIPAAQAARMHTLRGAVITPDGTVVPEFTVVVRPLTEKPELIPRKHFKDGQFTLNRLSGTKYQIEIVAPRYLATKVDVNFATLPNGTDYRIVILHRLGDSPQNTPGEIDQSGPDAGQRNIPPAAQAAYMRAAELHRDGHIDDALVAYGEALRCYPDFPQALSDVANIYIQVDRPQAALVYLHRAEQLDGEVNTIRMNTGVAHMAIGKYDEALKHFRALIRANAERPIPQYYTAKVYFLQRRLKLAEENIQAVLKDDPTFLDGWVLLIDIAREQKNQGLVREGLMHLRQAMKNGTLSKFLDEQLSVLGSD